MSLVHPFAFKNERKVRDEGDVEQCAMYPLIEALHKVYGLKVMAAEYKYDVRDADKSPMTVAYLSYDDVACVGYVRMCVSRKKTAYQFCSVVYTAHRGTGDDRRSLKSVDVRAMMRMIKKNNAVPTDGSVVHAPSKIGKPLNDIKRRIFNSFESTRKLDYIEPNELHGMLKILLTSGATHLPQAALNICKEAVDKWDRADSIRDARDKELIELVSSPMTLIGHDFTGKFIIGEIKYASMKGDEYTLTKPFVRCLNLLEMPELRAKLVMLKAHLEAIGYTRGFVDDGVFPKHYDKYVSELGIVCAKDSYGMPSLSEYNWMVLV